MMMMDRVFFCGLLLGQSMRNRQKRVATKSPILLKIWPVIGLYVKFNMWKEFLLNRTKVIEYLIFNVFIFARFARFLFFNFFRQLSL